MLDRLDLSLGGVIGRQAREFWWVYLLATCALFLTHRFQVELPFIARELGELVLARNTAEIPYAKYFLIALGIVFFRTFSRILFFWPARELQGYLQEELAMRLEQSSPWRYQTYSSGQIYQHLVTDVMHLRALVGFGLLQVGNIIIGLSVLLPRLIDFDPRLVIAFLPLLGCMVIFFFITTYTQRFYRQMTDLQGDVQNLIIESYEGKKTIKNFQAEPSFLQIFERGCQRELRAFFKGAMGPAASVPLTKLGVGLTFLWGAWIIHTHNMGSTTLILFSSFIFLFQGPLLFASWVGVVVSRSFGSWQRIEELVKQLERPSREELETEELNRGKEHFHSTLWGVEAAFPFRPHSWNVIVGETGSGKSTLIKSYATLLTQRGEGLCYVAQEPYLYNDSVRNNIFLGRTPSDAEVAKAQSLLELFQLGLLREGGTSLMDLQVGENGKRVSGGQAKRICLVRSLMSSGETLLWDDPFSSVDVILERKIVQQLKGSDAGKTPAGKLRTVILTSHRLSTVETCDQAFFIGEGEGAIEHGSVQELLNKKARFYEYFKPQMV